MAIFGLTDRGAAFPRVGILRKGGPKRTLEKNGRQIETSGVDLKDHFRFESDDHDAMTAFSAAYGTKPNHIRVMFYYPTAAENFETWQEHHSAGALKHRCDGRTCVLTLQANGTYAHEPVPCPSIELKRQNPQIDKKHLCRPVGRLKVIIPELQRMAYVLVPTTSVNDILELQANLEAAQALRGDLRGIPFVLSRRPRKISTPRDGGQRQRTEKWLLSVEPEPQWVRLQLVSMQQLALPSSTTLALPAPNGASYVDPDTGELFDDESDEADTITALQVALKQARLALKAAGGEPWHLSQAQVKAMSAATLRAEISATETARQALESVAEVAEGDFTEDYDAIAAAGTN